MATDDATANETRCLVCSLLLPPLNVYQYQRIEPLCERCFRKIDAAFAPAPSPEQDGRPHPSPSHTKLEDAVSRVRQVLIRLEKERDETRDQLREVKRGIRLDGEFELAFLDAYLDHFRTLRRERDDAREEAKRLRHRLDYPYLYHPILPRPASVKQVPETVQAVMVESLQACDQGQTPHFLEVRERGSAKVTRSRNMTGLSLDHFPAAKAQLMRGLDPERFHVMDRIVFPIPNHSDL